MARYKVSSYMRGEGFEYQSWTNDRVIDIGFAVGCYFRIGICVVALSRLSRILDVEKRICARASKALLEVWTPGANDSAHLNCYGAVLFQDWSEKRVCER